MLNGKLNPAVICEMKQSTQCTHQFQMSRLSDWETDDSRHSMILRLK